MKDEVRSELQRALQERRGECVIDHRESSGVRGKPYDCADVDDLEERVGWRLDPDHPHVGVLAERQGNGISVAQIHGNRLDAVASPDTVGEPPGPAIEVIAEKDGVTRIQ